ncbi:MAG: hypothetical protein GF398_05700 [Chitinivibrionales bacterium]|nr:hypothetical protein [Chitinivibrionales bacterium]
MNYPLKSILLLVLSTGISYGLSSIGVVNVRGNYIRSVHVKNNIVVDSFAIAQGSSPQINTAGTHVVFIPSGSNKVAIVRSDIAISSPDHAVKEVAVPSEPLGAVDWPHGDWVWYATTPLGAKTNSHIYRVHVNTKEVQKVAEYSNASLTDFRVTGDGSRYLVHGRASVELAAGNPDGCYAFIAPNPDKDAIPQVRQLERADVSYGPCGMGLNPSGTYSSSNAGSGHTIRDCWKIDLASKTMERPPYVKSFVREWSEWSLDSVFMYCVPYQDDTCERVEKTGGGAYTAGNWSCNSDYWDIPVLGWSPGGRFGENGSNMVAINYIGKKAFNISRYPHKSAFNWTTMSYGNEIADSGQRYNVAEGDMWVYEPIDDVTPSLRQAVTDRDSYEVEGLFVGSKIDLTIDPVDIRHSTAHRPASFTARLADEKMHLDGAMRAGARVELVSLDGSVLFSGVWDRRPLQVGAMPRGVAVARVETAGGMRSMLLQSVAR